MSVPQRALSRNACLFSTNPRTDHVFHLCACREVCVFSLNRRMATRVVVVPRFLRLDVVVASALTVAVALKCSRRLGLAAARHPFCTVPSGNCLVLQCLMHFSGRRRAAGRVAASVAGLQLVCSGLVLL